MTKMTEVSVQELHAMNGGALVWLVEVAAVAVGIAVAEMAGGFIDGWRERG
jgi:hypothetical protein